MFFHMQDQERAIGITANCLLFFLILYQEVPSAKTWLKICTDYFHYTIFSVKNATLNSTKKSGWGKICAGVIEKLFFFYLDLDIVHLPGIKTDYTDNEFVTSTIIVCRFAPQKYIITQCNLDLLQFNTCDTGEATHARILQI